MDRALRVAEFDVKDEALGALRKRDVDVTVIQYTRDGRISCCLLYLLKPVSHEILMLLTRLFKRIDDEDDIVVFEADRKNVGDVFVTLNRGFDLEFV